MTGDTTKKNKRLLSLYNLLFQYPKGLTASEIIEKTGVSRRNLYRDLGALQEQFGCTLYHQKGVWKLDSHNLLPPIQLNTMEAATIYIASRLLVGYSSMYNPNISSAFKRLSVVTPAVLREQITKTMDWMDKQNPDQQFLINLDGITRAWIEGHPVRIGYRTPGKAQSMDRVIEPYFIQPAALERANYVIGKCRMAGEIRTFKIERIRSVSILYNENYDIPADFDANEYLGQAWSISVYGDRPNETVKLRFVPPIDHIARETHWHPSQVTEPRSDKSVLVTFTLSITEEVESFILGWGKNVEVLEPKSLRKKIALLARETADLYKGK
jgi:predicted DNA-binding transcriptional regulator YafY